jgi:hypothetical protein
MNLGGINVGKFVGARGDSSQGGNGAGTNTSKDMVKVFCGKKVVGLIWRAGEVALLGVEFGVVGGSSTHAVEGAEMETMRLYQMLYPNVNSSRVWQIGCAKQTMIETKAEKFVIGHKALKDAPRWSVSLAVRPERCPSSEDFVLCNRLRPPRVSMICPLSEDFVLCNRL